MIPGLVIFSSDCYTKFRIYTRILFNIKYLQRSNILRLYITHIPKQTNEPDHIKTCLKALVVVILTFTCF